MFDIGPQNKSDSNFVAKCRLHQSKYRCEVLKEDYGYGPVKNSKNKFGNMLVDGEMTGSNFISNAAYKYAVQRTIDKNINKDLTIDSYRLFNNMMSSMPLCFNLFSDLRELLISDKNLCSVACKNLFKEISWLETVEYIGVEFIPTPIEKYTKDKTAFDAILITKDRNNIKGVVSVETKYTDLLGSNSSKNTDVKNKIVEDNNLFSTDIKERLKKNGYKQIYRNYLLTFAYAKVNKIRNYCNVILSPSSDEISQKEILELKNGLKKNKDSILKIDLEEFINRGIRIDAIENKFKKLKKRYIQL
jgi:hypothetical protein